MNRHSRRNQRPRMLYSRATAVVVNQNRVLLVKHNRENEWALPGGQVMAGEEPSRRAVLEVAEETGIIIADPQYVGRYAGTVASHNIYLAEGAGEPRPESEGSPGRHLVGWRERSEGAAARQRHHGHCAELAPGE